jgi:nucleoside 2-deoxyribosyltransferase
VIYLASPYSHPDAIVRKDRYRAACQAVAALLQAGHVAFSPIVHGHALVEHGLPTDWEFWRGCDQALLERCDEVVVLTLDGWEESDGVRGEVALAAELGRPVRYLAPEDAARSPTSVQVATGSPG